MVVTLGELRDTMTTIKEQQESILDHLNDGVGIGSSSSFEVAELTNTTVPANGQIFFNFTPKTKNVTVAIRFDKATDYRISMAYRALNTTSFILRGYKEIVRESDERMGVYTCSVDFLPRLRISNDGDEDVDVEFMQMAYFN